MLGVNSSYRELTGLNACGVNGQMFYRRSNVR
jgi:hypothetical protein